MQTRSVCGRLVALVALASGLGLAAPSARAGGWALVGHLGGVSGQQDIGFDDLDWQTGVADAAVERSLFGPLHLGVGGEFLFDADELEFLSREAGFAYAKLRLPVPFRPYAGVGVELRKTGQFVDDISTEGGWQTGRLFLAGAGFTVYRVSLDVEFRASRITDGSVTVDLYSLRPGVTVWF